MLIKITLGELLLTTLKKIASEKIAQEILGHCIDGYRPTEIETDIDYVDLIKGENDTISFLPISRLETTPEEERFTSRNRQRGKLGRKLSSLIGDVTFTPREIELFLKRIKENNSPFDENDFKLVTGKEINDCYDSDNYSYKNDGDDGSLANSCMGGAPDRYFKIYTKNKNCSLLVLNYKKNSKVYGRALVWSNVSINEHENVTYMDRIYCGIESEYDLFNAYAISKGWWYRSNQCYSDLATCTDPSGNTLKNPVIIVPIDNYEFDEYPYMDTLYNIVYSGPKVKEIGPYLTNINPSNKNSYYVCRDTDGGHSDYNYAFTPHFEFKEDFTKVNDIFYKLMDVATDEKYFKVITEIRMPSYTEPRRIYFLWNRNGKRSLLESTDEDFYNIRRPSNTPESGINKEEKELLHPLILRLCKDSWVTEE